jgi:hypothetical protein
MIYQIKVQGNVDPSWSNWFSGMDMSPDAGSGAQCVTTLTGYVRDQAALRGILNHLWDLNLTILSVIQIKQQATEM